MLPNDGTETDCTHYNQNDSNNNAILDYSLAENSKVIGGSIVFIAILPFVLFHFRRFPIGSTSAIILGALGMVLVQVINQDEVYEIIGRRDNLQTIFLLLGMMLLFQYLEREELISLLLRRVIGNKLNFENYLWRVCLLSFVLSAMFTNDACCVILTPLLLTFWSSEERAIAELEILLLGIATSANIGSVITIFGNPQMALIAARTDLPSMEKSKLNLSRCIIYLGPPALLGYFLNLGFLILYYRWQIKLKNSKDPDLPTKKKLLPDKDLLAKRSSKTFGCKLLNSNKDYSEKDMDSNRNEMEKETSLSMKEILDGYFNQSSAEEVYPLSCRLPTIHEDIPLETEKHDCRDHIQLTVEDSWSDPIDYSEDRRDSFDSAEEQCNEERRNSIKSQNDYNEGGLELSKRLGISRSLTGISPVAEFLPPVAESSLIRKKRGSDDFSPSFSRFFEIFLCFIILLVIVLFFISSKFLKFDIGLIPLAAAILTIFVDALFNKCNASIIIKRVDWSILLMFFGIFVWMHGLNTTRLPRWGWKQLGLSNSNFKDVSSIAILGAFVMLGSNIFSNVPLTLIVLEQIPPCKDQFALILYLAWIATIAGNLTLFGSVANLIVAQKAWQTLEFRLTFWNYLRYGFISTLIITLFGIIIIYYLLQI